MTWDPMWPAELQDASWTCSAASLAWAMSAGGFETTELSVVVGLGPARISPALGLLDASGAGLVDYCRELGIGAENNGNASWSDVVAAAGSQPLLIGGRGWNHWTGVRLGFTYPATGETYLVLANPAPGWMAVFNILSEADFLRLGAFSAVWLLL